MRGDVSLDGELDVGDALQMLFCVFTGAGCASCEDAIDANDDSATDVLDPVHLLAFLFRRGAPLAAPGPGCGIDPTEDPLGCRSFPPCSSPDSIPTSRGDLLVIPIEHGSVVLCWDGKTIYADPAGGAGLYAGLPRANIALVTHTHRDHLDAGTLRSVVDESTVLVVPQAVASALSGSEILDTVDERVIANGETTGIDEVTVEAVPMYNLTPDRLRYHEQGVGNGYVLDLDGTRVYVSGDTEDIPEMRALEGIDLAFISMNLPFTMTPDQAASAVLEFEPRVVYPYHYSGQDPVLFRTLVNASAPHIEVRLREWYP